MSSSRGRSVVVHRFVLAAAAAATAALSACAHGGGSQQCVAAGPSPAAVAAPAPAVAAPAPAVAPPVAAPEPPAPLAVDPSQIVARVDGAVITVGDVQERINKQSPFVRARYAALDKMKEFLDGLIRFELMSAEAQRRGYDRDPEVLRVMKQQMISKFLQKEFEAKMRVEDVPDADVEAYYRDNRAEFDQRPLAEVRRQIQQRLFRDHRTKALDAFVDDLRGGHRVDIIPENLKKVVVDTK